VSEPLDVRVEAREPSGPRTCVYCRDPVEAPTVCERCDAAYHPDCRVELGRCATPGCAGAGVRAVPRPEFARDWRETAQEAVPSRPAEETQLPQLAPRAIDLRARRPRVDGADRVGPMALLLDLSAIVAFALLLVAAAFGLRRVEAGHDGSRAAVELFTVFGTLFSPALVPVVLRQALQALLGPRTRPAGGLVLLLLAGAAGLALATGGWWTVPYHLMGVSVIAAVVESVRRSG